MATTTDNDWTPSDYEEKDKLFLDNAYEDILPGSYIVIQTPGKEVKTFKVNAVNTLPRTAYGMSAKATLLDLDGAWFDPKVDDMKIIRKSGVFARSEPLELAEEPVFDSNGFVADISGGEIELDGLYDGLQSGRWIIVSGERTDVPGTTGVVASELAMVSGARQYVDPAVPGDTAHTTLTLAQPLAYRYKRDTVTIAANVVKATHGETRTETLGSGDGSKPLQQFALRQSPLTYVSAPTASGTASTLQVRVNDILWHEADTLEGLAPAARSFITTTDDDAKTRVTFGNGRQGSRLPTGVENVKAVYRTGIGSAGNVKAGQVSLLATKPLGVKSVNNPIRASGGADRETRDQARRNAPLVTMALDRLVSVQDYADYARTFAGIGKADARMITDGYRQVVHLTIAGADDIPIDETSDLYRNLQLALQKYGDPYQPFVVAVRELLAILISANVKLLPDYAWETTEPKIRAALLEALSFDRRELGQKVFLSEVISVIQGVGGVDYLDILDFRGITQAGLLEIMDGSSGTRKGPATPGTSIRLRRCPVINASVARSDPEDPDPVKKILPAQLAYLLPGVPDNLVLNEVKK
jgi:predicted phage baseplate assembly protein